ncbi:unnamed protein product [Ilex paraguariensis]|uniref:Uncharacterized protein n=1 Tax=Ilex paraguariensis TaxID=185542 RepID=A0ABC8SA53_9AQUA
MEEVKKEEEEMKGEKEEYLRIYLRQNSWCSLLLLPLVVTASRLHMGFGVCSKDIHGVFYIHKLAMCMSEFLSNALVGVMLPTVGSMVGKAYQKLGDLNLRYVFIDPFLSFHFFDSPVSFEERLKAGFSDESFSGVPVFQSKSLILRSQNKRYRPVFFRKEDLEKSLLRASRQQKKLNPAFREGDIQVAVLEDIIQGMKKKARWVVRFCCRLLYLAF